MWRDVLVVRRRAHVVILDDSMHVTIPAWPLYWSPDQMRTFVEINRCGPERLWLPLSRLVGHWDWFAGRIVGAYIRDGYGPAGMPRPKYARITRMSKMDPDTGAAYWYSDALAHVPRMPEPMANM